MARDTSNLTTPRSTQQPASPHPLTSPQPHDPHLGPENDPSSLPNFGGVRSDQPREKGTATPTAGGGTPAQGNAAGGRRVPINQDEAHPSSANPPIKGHQIAEAAQIESGGVPQHQAHLLNKGSSPQPSRPVGPMPPTAAGPTGNRAVPINEDEAHPTHRLNDTLNPAVGTAKESIVNTQAGANPPRATGGKPLVPSGPGIRTAPKAAQTAASHPLGVGTQTKPQVTGAKPGARSAQQILDAASAVKPAGSAPNTVGSGTAGSLAPAASTSTETLGDLADSLLQTFKMQYGNLWNNTFTPQDQQILTDVMDDVALVAHNQLAGSDTAGLRQQIEAQLSNVAGTQHSQLVHAVWATLGQVAKSSLDFALKAALTLVPAGA